MQWYINGVSDPTIRDGASDGFVPGRTKGLTNLSDLPCMWNSVDFRYRMSEIHKSTNHHYDSLQTIGMVINNIVGTKRAPRRGR